MIRLGVLTNADRGSYSEPLIIVTGAPLSDVVEDVSRCEQFKNTVEKNLTKPTTI